MKKDNKDISNKKFKQLIDDLLRSTKYGISSYFTEVKVNFAVQDTKAVSHCYFLNLDRKKQPRTNDLAKFVARQLIDYSIPRDQIKNAKKEDEKHNTTQYTVELSEKARGLFTTVKKTGEGGEMLLYILVRQILKLPQLICKMPLKTNPESHYQGVDGIHVSVDKNKSGESILCLYWGESKLYKNINKAIADCFSSVKNYLLSEDGTRSSVERDLQLIQDNLNLENEELEGAIVQYLDKDNPLHNQVDYKAVCLVGFDYDEYPTKPNTKTTAVQIKNKIEKKLSEWNKKVSTNIAKHANLNTFDMHVFLIPFPSVEEFRASFLDALGIKKS